MGRIAGVSATETRQRLLDAAAGAFAEHGYDGSSLADICARAGLSTGAVYAHWAGKAELFVATLRAHGTREIERLLGGDDAVDLPTFLAVRGAALEHRSPVQRTLLIEAVVAAKRHPEVAEVLAASFDQRERQLAGLLRSAQDGHDVDAALHPDAVARFVLMLALGSMVTSALELPDLPPGAWVSLIDRLVEQVRPPAATDAHHGPPTQHQHQEEPTP